MHTPYTQLLQDKGRICIGGLPTSYCLTKHFLSTYRKLYTNEGQIGQELPQGLGKFRKLETLLIWQLLFRIVLALKNGMASNLSHPMQTSIVSDLLSNNPLWPLSIPTHSFHQPFHLPFDIASIAAQCLVVAMR